MCKVYNNNNKKMIFTVTYWVGRKTIKEGVKKEKKKLKKKFTLYTRAGSKNHYPNIQLYPP